MKITVQVQASVSWWVRPYLAVLWFLCTALDRELVAERVQPIVRRGIRARIRQDL